MQFAILPSISVRLSGNIKAHAFTSAALNVQVLEVTQLAHHGRQAPGYRG
jgi:hypothetical protein